MTKLFYFFVSIGLAACSAAPEGVSVHDPYEAQNREIHAFNKSVAESLGGNAEDSNDTSGPRIPPDIAVHVLNVADNVSLPGKIINGVLQGNLGGASTNTVRFMVNTIFGVFGVWDPADAIGLTEVDTDFGQTLAVWGAPEGAYLELPFVGPSTERDLAGDVVDFLIDPLGQFLTNDQQLIATASTIAGRVVKLDQAGDVIGDVLSESADSYTQAQLIYLQNRRFELVLDDIDAIDPYDEVFGDP